ncbi:NAD-dependent epimerase/dehydratase family protein [Phytomonospora endophytica]|uniref:Nucleoside-diphosphate-sugar epimerase n=1 Tax=Phytomonospora endophytica TaxID=714109 RepID=A0A841FMB4_9ACTN|nr:NAD-dependent epimerase/dehydratase family protein [Phytomonospora endophytica]MBB6037276.1 nucleoside-diphosphate-sugar epimerase [Phytomonospora endophytica]GIG69980.1 epimerase [Phytomonospora endophytica]
MRVLLLGGTKFIGRRVASRLLDGHAVTLLNRGSDPLWDRDLRRVTADRTDAAATAAALSGDHDVVVDISGTRPEHLAGTLDFPGRYIYLSSAAVYDQTAAGLPFREGDPAHGDPAWGEYGHDKAACERLLTEAYGERLTVLRPPYVYGPFNDLPRESFVWARLLCGETVFVPGDGDRLIQFCHVDALAEVVAAAVEERLDPGVYNVAESTPYGLAGWVRILAKAAGTEAPMSPVDDERIDAREYFPFRDMDLVLDTTRIDAAGVLPYVPLPVGAASTFRWFKANGGLAFEPTAYERSRG